MIRCILLSLGIGLVTLLPTLKLSAHNISVAYSSFNYNIDKTINGIVLDANNKPLEGVSITLKNTAIVATSDKLGKFSIRIPEKGGVLVFTSVNYATIEKSVVTTSQFLTIQMKENVSTLTDVIVVGYATQKKINVTGAISTIEGKNLVSASVGNITTALIGNAPGISGLQGGGEPGRNATTIYIRGLSTYNTAGASPLVVIDGVEQAAEQPLVQLNAMDPNEIASISILKDAASTAVYGIRGANGVIIVTTKRGTKAKQAISINSNYGFTKATHLMKTTNSYEFALLRNEAININKNQLGDNSFNSYLFTTDELWKYQNNRDYTPAEVDAMLISDDQKAKLKAAPAIWFGSRDLMKEQFGATGPQAQVNLNIRGGNDKVQYFTSLGYFSQGSILANTSFAGSNTGSKYNRYNFRSSFDFHPTKNLDISLNLAGQFGTTSGFDGNQTNQDRYKTLLSNVLGGFPSMVPGIIDGRLISNWARVQGTPGDAISQKFVTTTDPLYILLTSGQGIVYNTFLSNTIKVVHRLDYLAKGLSIRATLGYDDNYSKFVTINPSLASYQVSRDLANPNNLVFYGGSYSATTINTSSSISSWNKTYVDVGIDYATSIGEHKFTALALGKSSVYKIPSDGFNTPSGIMGLVGRVTYSFKDRYLAEVNLGYNGTEQFAPGKRFGLFPAYSLGWVATNEPFFKKNKWVNFLKVRGSYGEVGSDNLNGRRYLYLPNAYSQNQPGRSYYFGASNGSTANPAYTGAFEGAIGNPNVTWERAVKVDLGLEARFINDHLSLTLDLFKEDRKDILTASGIIPAPFGVTASNIPPINIGTTTNHGYELSLGWKDEIGKINYSFNGSVSYARNKVLYRAEAPNPYQWMNATGYSIGQYKGLISDGFYNNSSELSNRPYVVYGSNQAVVGDIKYKDINGDGIIDNKDQVPIGYNNLPEYAYNLRFHLDYKGFDLGLLFIGTANGSFYLNSGYTQIFSKQSGMVFKWQYDDRWTPEKAASGAPIYYPRPQIDPTTGANFSQSDFWLRSTNFIKLKNVEIGYTVPASMLRKAGLSVISSIRLYANGNNIYTFKNDLMKHGIDPETKDPGTSNFFPLTQAFVFGANINL